MSPMNIISRKRTMVSRRILTASAVLLALPGAAHAQSVDYTELQKLFGEPVTTSVTGKPQRASDAPAALTIITRDDIRRSPAMDIPGLLAAYAGIDVARWTNGQSDVAIRGGMKPYNSSLLVLVNGHQVYLDYYGMTNWSGIGVQLEEIQQIEIVRGPNSALFGFNAGSGVINIITIDPLQTQQLVTTLEAGTDDQLRLSQSAAIKLSDRFGLRLSAGYGKSAERDGVDGSVPAINPRHKEASAELYVQRDARTEGGLSVSHTSNHQLDFIPPLQTVRGYYTFTSVAAHVSHDTGWGLLSARAFRNWSDITSSSPAIDINFHNKVFVASADALIRAGISNSVRLGVEYRANTLTISPGYPGATRYDVFAGSGMWESRLSDAVTFTIAARLDHLQLEQTGVVNQPTIFTKQDFNRSITAWSFNSGLLFRLNEMTSMRIAAGRGIEAPSLFFFGARLVFPVPGTPLSVVSSGNPYLDPTIIKSGEIGLIHMFDQNSMRFELTAFYNERSDIISGGSTLTSPRAGPPAYPFILITGDNVGTFEAYGIEASLNGRFGKSWPWAVNYTWTRARQDIAGNVGSVYLQPLALDKATPKHKVKAQLSYESGPWLATLAARYTSRIDQLVDLLGNGAFRLVKVDANVALDAKLAFKATDNLTFAIAGENLTNAAGADMSPAPAQRRLRATVQVRF